MWVDGVDGQPLRTEDATKQLLISHGLQVSHSETYGRNDCLIDSVLQSLSSAGLMRSDMPAAERNSIAARVRKYLEDRGETRRGAYEFLGHDQHLPHIFDYLFTNCGDSWLNLHQARATEFTIIVYDRFQLRTLRAVSYTHLTLPTKA